MNFRWRVASPAPEAAQTLAHHFGLTPLLAQCIINRGFSSVDAASGWLEPRLRNLQDPWLLPNMPAAVERLLRARDQHEPLVIFGDYDVDGVSATALLLSFFREHGWQASAYLPNRFDEGYGLSHEGVQNCLQQHPVKLLLAVDCGSASPEVIDQCAANGVETIVLDHHQPADRLPASAIMVNPQLGSQFHELSAVGLAFKLVHALCKRGRELNLASVNEADVRPFLDLVALGTIADIVPLRGENRILVSAGLARLANTARPGLLALKRVAGLTGAVEAGQVAFQLAPRLNAAGRLASAQAALELLLTADVPAAQRLAADLDATNRDRQSTERRILREVLEEARSVFHADHTGALVLGRSEWHIGVVGIVASRVLREFHRPTILLGGDGSGEHWRGSGRSIEGFNLAAALRDCGDLLVKGGGHAMAAGLTIAPDNLEAFRTRLNSLVLESTTPEQRQPILRLDAETRLDELTAAFGAQLEKLDPIGCENPGVQLCVRNVGLKGIPRRMGSDQQHLKAIVTDGCHECTMVWWNAPAGYTFPAAFDLAFQPEWSEYKGASSLQLKLLDCRPA